MNLSWINPLPNKFGVFVSHSSRDRGVAISISSALKAHGVPTWLSSGEEKIDSGNWDKKVKRALRSEGAFLLLVSQDSLSSTEVQKEINMARDLERPMYILGLDGEAEARRLLKARGYEDLCTQVIRDADNLSRQEAQDSYDQCARGIAEYVRSQQILRSLRALSVMCVGIFSTLYFAGPLSDFSFNLAKSIMAPAKSVLIERPAEGNKVALPTMKQNSPSAPSPTMVASLPAVAATQPFVLPRFLKNPPIPLRSRLLSSWTASSEGVSFQADLRFNAEVLQGSVVTLNKKTSERCSYQVNSIAVETGYVKLVPYRSGAGCVLKALHIGYRSEELIQVIFEGGSLTGRSVNREL